ncbi:MAG: hypothetical protein HY505_01540 [Candidatus Yanofskybacteria bacterium]|nr:hypothetical protein [Candidatus Yanofskybacteria bacterium]
MPDLTVLRAKVNPRGKDRRGPLTTNRQRNAEWVDIKNTSGRTLSVSGVAVFDHTFAPFACRTIGRRVIYQFPQLTLTPGQIVRIHSGNPVPVADLPEEDRLGADWHAFTSKDFVWNNTCGDTAEIWSSGVSRVLIDKASYSPSPLEGKILTRVGAYLV